MTGHLDGLDTSVVLDTITARTSVYPAIVVVADPAGRTRLFDGLDKATLREVASELGARRVWIETHRRPVLAGFAAASGIALLGARDLGMIRSNLTPGAGVAVEEGEPWGGFFGDDLGGLRAWATGLGLATTFGVSTWWDGAITRLAPTSTVARTLTVRAVRAARLLAFAPTVQSPAEMSLTQVDVELQRRWDRVQTRGIRIDVDELRQRLTTLETAVAEGESKLGARVSLDYAAHEWCDINGIVLAQEDGQPTLSHRVWGKAIVPDEAREEWEVFKEARTAAGHRGELVQIRSALRGDRVHPRFEVFATVTGRMTVTGPNLQGLSTRTRDLVVAEDGMSLVGLDIDRCEPRVMALLSGDIELTAALAPGRDLYVELAQRIWPNVVITKELRAQAKVAFLAPVYGQGARGLRERLGLPTLEDAEQLLASSRAAFPALDAWLRSIAQAARTNPDAQFYTAGGRRIQLPDPDKRYRIPNLIVQGSAAELFKARTLQLDGALTAAGMPGSLLVPIHDEIVVLVPETRAEEAAAILEQVFTRPLGDVPMCGTATVFGRRFGKA